MSKPSVLLLDEDPLLLQATAMMLSKRGAAVSVVASAEAAVAASASRHFDVVVLDVAQEGTSAFEIVRAMDASGAEPGKIVVCYEAPIPRHEAHVFTEMLAKPYAFELLVAAVFDEARRAPSHSGVFTRSQPASAWRTSSSRLRTTTRRRSNVMS